MGRLSGYIRVNVNSPTVSGCLRYLLIGDDPLHRGGVGFFLEVLRFLRLGNNTSEVFK